MTIEKAIIRLTYPTYSDLKAATLEDLGFRTLAERWTDAATDYRRAKQNAEAASAKEGLRDLMADAFSNLEEVTETTADKALRTTHEALERIGVVVQAIREKLIEAAEISDPTIRERTSGVGIF